MGDEVFYKKENENEWRVPAKVVGVSGKTVVVKHGESLREIAKIHVTRIQSQSLEKERTTDARGGCSLDDMSCAATGENIGPQEEENMVGGWKR